MFVEWLKQQTGVTIVPAPADAERAVRDRDEDVVLIIDKDFAKDMARAVPAPVKLVSDATRDSARPKVARVRNLIATYSQMTGGLRLISAASRRRWRPRCGSKKSRCRAPSSAWRRS